MRLCMPCVDRPGLLLEITQKLVKWGMNIAAVETHNEAFYLECHPIFPGQKLQVIQALQQVEGIHEVREVSYMPSKERAEQLEAVLTSVQDGVLAVDERGILTQCNKAALAILKMKEDNLGEPLSTDLMKSLLVSQTLCESCSYRNREVFIESIGGYCVVSTHPLRDDTNKVAGVVITIRDSRDIRDLMQKMTASMPVTFMDISFASPAMGKVLEQARRYAVSSSTVLIRGETGTGKELFARALHSASSRAKKHFCPLTVRRFPIHCWRANCSVMKMVHLPALPKAGSQVYLNLPMVVRCFLMRLERYRYIFRPSSCGSCRKSGFAALEVPVNCQLMSV